MVDICIVEKYPTSYAYDALFPFTFDKVSLVNTKMEKVLKRDIILDIEEVKDKYKYIILVGKEPCKLVADIRSVTEFQGHLVDDKYLALMNPIAVKLQPSKKDSFDKAVNDIINTIEQDGVTIGETHTLGINTEDYAELYLLNLLEKVKNSEVTHIAMDTETSAFYPRDGYLLGISMAYDHENGAYIDAMSLPDPLLQILQEIIDRVTILFFNAKFDRKFLEYYCNLNFPNWEDVMLEHYDLDENDSHGLKGLAIKYTDLGNYDKDLETWKANYCKENKVKVESFTYDLIPFDVISKYAAIDAIATYRLHFKFKPYINANEKLLHVYNNLLIKGSNALHKFEENGIPLASKETIEKYILVITDEIETLTKSLYGYEEVKKVEELKGKIFNVNSTYHVSCLFFEVLKLKVIKLTETGNPSADSEVLETLAKEHPVAEIINKIKKLKKIKSTYLDKMLQGMDSDGRLRTNFNLHTTTSGRLSSSGKINAQQLPRDNKIVKKCIEARPGFKIVSQDLGTAEMYIAAVLSGDKALQNVFITGEDYHGFMAVQKFNLSCKPNEVKIIYPELRQDAKTISFEILYKLNYREPVLEKFPKLRKWLQEQESFIKTNGYIYSIFGRKRRLSDVYSPDKKEGQHQVRSGINFLVQSVASDINLLAAIDMQEYIEQNNLEDYIKIFGLVHDSILAEVHDDYISIYCATLKELTQKNRGASLPNCPIKLDVDIGQNYAFV